jgi:hypothetical protein
MSIDSISIEQLTEIGKMAGLVVAGLWTAWTFNRLHKVRAAELANNKTLIEIEKGRMDIEKSRVEIEKDRIEIEKNRVDTEKARADTDKSRIEQQEIRERIRSQQPQLAIALEVSESNPSGENYKSILGIMVILKNEGNQNLWVGFNKSTLTIGRLEFRKNGKQRLISAEHFEPMYIPEQSRVLRTIPWRILRVGQARRMTLALVPITTFGSYLIQFSATYARATLGENGEETRDDEIIINAVEQIFYVATGKAAAQAPPSPAEQSS